MTLLRWRPGSRLSNIVRNRHWMAALVWATFCAGLLVQVYAPGLRVRNNTFIIPPSLVSNGQEVKPAELVGRERRMQWISVILTVGGALGLAFRYRRVLIRPRAS